MEKQPQGEQPREVKAEVEIVETPEQLSRLVDEGQGSVQSTVEGTTGSRQKAVENMGGTVGPETQQNVDSLLEKGTSITQQFKNTLSRLGMGKKAYQEFHGDRHIGTTAIEKGQAVKTAGQDIKEGVKKSFQEVAAVTPGAEKKRLGTEQDLEAMAAPSEQVQALKDKPSLEANEVGVLSKVREIENELGSKVVEARGLIRSGGDPAKLQEITNEIAQLSQQRESVVSSGQGNEIKIPEQELGSATSMEIFRRPEHLAEEDFDVESDLDFYESALEKPEDLPGGKLQEYEFERDELNKRKQDIDAAESDAKGKDAGNKFQSKYLEMVNAHSDINEQFSQVLTSEKFASLLQATNPQFVEFIRKNGGEDMNFRRTPEGDVIAFTGTQAHMIDAAILNAENFETYFKDLGPALLSLPEAHLTPEQIQEIKDLEEREPKASPPTSTPPTGGGPTGPGDNVVPISRGRSPRGDEEAA